METQAPKVYVAVGTDLQDGLGALKWALRRWPSHSTSIVILYATNDVCRDYVYTPIGKLPASSVSDKKLEDLRKSEEGKIKKLLSKYIAFCGKNKAEIFRIGIDGEPIQKQMVELISKLEITKLVMGITFMTSPSPSLKSRSAISGLFHIHRHKPSFCEFFVIRGGKLVCLREENKEEFIEDDQGVMVAKVREKASLRRWLGRMFPESSTNEKDPHGSSSSSSSNDSPSRWENCVQEVNIYFHQLLSSNSGEENRELEIEEASRTSPESPDVPENMSDADKIEFLKIRIAKAAEAIRLSRQEAKDNAERQVKAEWAICLCTPRVEELEARTREERANCIALERELDTAKEQVEEIQSEVEEKRSKLNSIMELQHELANKLRLSSSAKSRAEAELVKAMAGRAEMVHEIEKLRRQRDVLQRRIEFCREKDAIGTATRLSEVGFDCRAFTAEEIRAATDDFSERLSLKSAGDWTNVYRGRINHTTVAIKLFDSANGPSQDVFQAKVKNLSRIRHPHLVAAVGFCSEPKCIVFEYMHSGCLRDMLFSGDRRRNRRLDWHARIRIAAEVCSGLGFLQSARPRPIIHGNLNPSKVLLDRNLVAKIHGFRLDWSYDESDVSSDIRSFGNLVLQLLTGRNWAGLVEEAVVMDCQALSEVLDEMAGKWPLELAMELAKIAVRCLSSDQRLATVGREIGEVRKKADELVANEGRIEVGIEGDIDMEDSTDVPSAFLCPIFQDVMKNPHVAADGFSYEQEAIEGWFRTGHDTSPMTKAKLKHKQVTPNHILRSLILDWHNKNCFTPT